MSPSTCTHRLHLPVGPPTQNLEFNTVGKSEMEYKQLFALRRLLLRFVVVVAFLLCEYAVYVLTEINLLFFSKYDARCFGTHTHTHTHTSLLSRQGISSFSLKF